MSKRLCWIMMIVLVLTGCASEKPVLYPNSTLARRGETAGDAAINACMQQAEANGLSYSKGRVARRTVESGAVGGAGGAVGGAIYGNAARGAAIGAAGGATVGLLRGLFARNDPAPVYRAYVNRCLRDRGYDPIGWN